MKLLICTQVLDKNHPILGFFHRWVEEFAKHCAVVHVICLQEGAHTLPANVHVHSLGKEQGRGRLTYLWRFYKTFGHLFFSREIDTVFYHMGAIYNVVGAPFFFLRKFYRVSFYWWKAHGRLSVMSRLAGAFIDTVVTSTMSGYKAWPKKRKIVGQAIDTNLFTSGVGDNHRVSKQVLYTGRVMPVKRMDVILEVARRLKPEGYHFVVIGPTDKKNTAFNQKIVTEFKLAGIQYLGPLPHHELHSWYRSSDFFINPSETGSMDKTVLEAMLSGCVPLTANEAFTELLKPFGLMVKENKATAYVTALAQLAKGDTESLRRELRQEVATEHGLDTFYQRIFL